MCLQGHRGSEISLSEWRDVGPAAAADYGAGIEWYIWLCSHALPCEMNLMLLSANLRFDKLTCVLIWIVFKKRSSDAWYIYNISVISWCQRFQNYSISVESVEHYSSKVCGRELSKKSILKLKEWGALSAVEQNRRHLRLPIVFTCLSDMSVIG